ncbi:hypothetical protein EDC04DRAFT_2823081 [Pisolithus marmoratus]|nr:hypothetical protein EDC04DRAFT_2823081 [Pisolithus marmoratus]
MIAFVPTRYSLSGWSIMCIVALPAYGLWNFTIASFEVGGLFEARLWCKFDRVPTALSSGIVCRLGSLSTPLR